MTQAQALKIMLSGSNIFLTGAPGSGKTFLLRQFINKAKADGQAVAITATTGIAATHLEGITIHAWAGIGIKDQMTSRVLAEHIRIKKLVERYRNCDILVIDEISMLDGQRLKLIDQLAKAIRSSKEAIGGLQVILVGDLFQLPPINAGSEPIYNSATWKELDLKVCYLSEQHRQDSTDELYAVLTAIRQNRVSITEINVLKSKLAADRAKKANILRLYSHNYDADKLNEAKLAELDTKPREYKMRNKGSIKDLSILSPSLLTLKKGAEVIFTANNYRSGYVNGDRGRVVDFKKGLPVVRLKRSMYLSVSQHRWRAEVNGLVTAEAWQLPLRLAWAITIHKSQGMSLEEAEIDLSHAFSPAMGYVALSRLRSIDGLCLLGLNKMALIVNPGLQTIDRDMRASSDSLSASL